VKVGYRRGLTSVGASLATLYLPPTASAQDAKRAYRELVRLLHPDTAGGHTQNEELSAVIGAYQNLVDSGWLAEHDETVVRRNGDLFDARA
jgi:DnaJ-class molecular chaperone